MKARPRIGERPSVWDEQERLARDHLADCVESMVVPHDAVVERAASGAELQWPAGWAVWPHRKYGDTRLEMAQLQPTG